MSKSNKLMLFLTILGIIIAIIVSFPSWKGYFYDSGPIYYSQSNQKLKTVLNVSKITKNLIDYYKFDIEPALDLKIKEGHYTGSGSYKFLKSFKIKMYVSLLGDILLRNEDQIEYYIDEEAKIIFIRPKP